MLLSKRCLQSLLNPRDSQGHQPYLWAPVVSPVKGQGQLHATRRYAWLSIPEQLSSLSRSPRYKWDTAWLAAQCLVVSEAPYHLPIIFVSSLTQRCRRP